MKNRERRKIIGGIFADTAKYSLTAGVIGSIVSGSFSADIAALLGVSAIVMGILAYVVTAEDKPEGSK